MGLAGLGDWSGPTRLHPGPDRGPLQSPGSRAKYRETQVGGRAGPGRSHARDLKKGSPSANSSVKQAWDILSSYNLGDSLFGGVKQILWQSNVLDFPTTNILLNSSRQYLYFCRGASTGRQHSAESVVAPLYLSPNN